MADKINNEECIARVYQFLNTHKNWQTEADYTGDGIILKAEFRKYLVECDFKFNNDEVDVFWKSIDTDRTGKVTAGSRINDKNALNVNEIDNVEKSIQATKQIIAFMKDKEAPQNITDSGLRSKWKNSVKQGLIYRASEFLKNASLEDLTDEWLNEAYRQSSIKATADYTALSIIEKKLGNIDNYKVGSDENLKAIIDAYIAELTDSPKSEEEVIADINAIINAYIDTANTNSKESTDLLYDYGYDPDNGLNDLQTAVLTKQISEQLINYIKNNNSDIYTDEFKGQIEASVTEFVENYLKGRSASEFSTLKAFDVAEYTKTEDYNTLITAMKKRVEEIQEARNDLNQYLAQIIADNDPDIIDIVKQVMGINSTDATVIMNKILELKTVDDINAKKNEIETKINELKAKIEAEKAAKQEAYKASFGKLAEGVEDVLTTSVYKMTCNYSSIHTEFGLDANGNIVFEQPETNNVYEKVKSEIKYELKLHYKDAYNNIGEANIEKLIQSAWIMTYNTYNSSERNNTAQFILKMLDNFKSILSKLQEKPEYLDVYTSHSAYGNNKLTSKLIYYGHNNSTAGGDNFWIYDGGYTVLSDGSITFADHEDGSEYSAEMSTLLKTILKTEPYKNLDPEVVTKVFRDAQKQAITACCNNINDCPYGTTPQVDGSHVGHRAFYGSKGVSSLSAATPNTDWGGTNRDNDGWWITVEAIVELTLYYFDKMLYSELLK